MTRTGLIFDIQGFSVQDGPGCRTLVFLSGCPLRCAWCSNPEGQRGQKVLMYRGSKCGCPQFACIEECPRHAIARTGDPESPLSFDRTKCDRCAAFNCQNACFREALRVCSDYYSVDELMRIIKRDSTYWGSGGGVTFGGGEPMFQKEFLLEVLARCRSACIHVALETSAHVPTDDFLQIMESVNWAFIDIKHMDREKHREGTGAGNTLILENIHALPASGWPGRLLIRFPIIPGFNDDYENILATIKFLKENEIGEINLLPFHRMGESKYRQLGMTYAYRDVHPPSTGFMETVRNVFQSNGIRCWLGHDTPF